MKKQNGFWYEGGVVVESFSCDVRNNWRKSWIEKGGFVERVSYFHKLHGGTFVYPQWK